MKKLPAVNKLFLSSAIALLPLISPLQGSFSDMEEEDDPSHKSISFSLDDEKQVVWTAEKKKDLIDRVNTYQDTYAFKELLKAYKGGIFTGKKLRKITLKAIPDEILRRQDDVTALCLFLALNTAPEDPSFFKQLDAMKTTNSVALSFVGCCYEWSLGGCEKDCEKAFGFFTSAATQGYAVAQCILGNYYEINYNMSLVKKEDLAEAIKWYTKAAKQGHPKAQYRLGFHHENFEESFKWYTEAAIQGHPEAQYYLGSFYYSGKVVKKSLEKAIKWFSLAANQGHAEAQYHLGWCYEWGQGVKKDLAKAVKWYILAGQKKGVSAAHFCLKQLVQLDNAAVEESEIPERENIDHIKGCIQGVLDDTTYWMGLSGDHDLPDSFGPMPVLKEKAEKLERFYREMFNLLSLLEDPDFAVTCLTIENQELKDSLPKIQDVPYLSFNRAYEDFSESIGKKNQEALAMVHQLQDWSGKIQEILRDPDLMETKKTLKANLKGIEIGNEELAQFITPFFQRYFNAKEEAQEREALTRISKFLESFEQSLEPQMKLLTNLKIQDDLGDPSTVKYYAFKALFEKLMAETAGYRNHLFIEKYGNAFKS